MCMIDNSEGRCEFLYERLPRSAKAHLCCECGRSIAQGETYQQSTAVWERGSAPKRYCCCLHCLAGRKWLIEQCAGFLFSGVLEDLKEHWREDFTLHRFRLGRLIVGMRKQWTKKSGQLMRIP